MAILIGSLGRDSYNRKLANAIKKLAPPEFSFQELRSTICRCTTRTTIPISLSQSSGCDWNQSRSCGGLRYT